VAPSVCSGVGEIPAGANPAGANRRYSDAVRLLFIIDPLEKLGLAGDTSYALMVEASRRDHEIWTCQIEHLGLEHDDPVAAAQLTLVREADTPTEAFSVESRVPIPLDAFDMVLMRKDPPVDVNYLHATWILEQARGRTLLVNDPRGLRELNEHLAVLRFPELTPPTLVTRDARRLATFQREQGGAIVVKPVDGFGGLGVFVVRDGDPNASSIYETSTAAGTRWTMAQRYLPEAVDGDKRILLVDGESVGAVLRVPGKNEARGNLHVGGRAVKTELDADDRAIIATIVPTLRQFGQILVGIDVIGGRLTEINITSPTGIRHIEALDHRNVAADVLERLERAALARTAAR
jgi:glutathione synthase